MALAKVHQVIEEEAFQAFSADKEAHSVIM